MEQCSGDLYEIWVKEPVHPSWSEWLEDLAITRIEGEGTRMIGRVKDKTALYGLLNRMRDLNLTLISVTKVE